MILSKCEWQCEISTWNFLALKTKTFCLMHQPVSYLYFHFLFLLLINYIDCRRSMETVDFTLQIFLFTLYCFSPKTEIFLWIAFPLWFTSLFPTLLKWLRVMGWGRWGRISHLCITLLTSALRTTKFISSILDTWIINKQHLDNHKFWLLICPGFQVETLRLLYWFYVQL